MRLLSVDLGGTKIATAIFDSAGSIISKTVVLLNGRTGKEVSELVQIQVAEAIELCDKAADPIVSIGVSVPGISNKKEGAIWAPNIPGWDKYPLFNEIKQVAPNVALTIESDRTCYILGEMWKGSAKNCTDAIYMAVGTGIGVGIVINGQVINGANDIAGCAGWMALKDPYQTKFDKCGHFEYFASGEGIARLAVELIDEDDAYNGELKFKEGKLVAGDVFKAHGSADPIAIAVFEQCITYWGMAIANLISLFNPQKIVLGGGVFGPAKQFIPLIYNEAKKWAQPISFGLCTLEPSALDFDAGLYGAGYAALRNLNHKKPCTIKD